MAKKVESVLRRFFYFCPFLSGHSLKTDPPPFIRLKSVTGETIGLIVLWIDNVLVLCKDPSLRDLWAVRLKRNASENEAEGGCHAIWKEFIVSDSPDFIGIHFKTTETGVSWCHEKARTEKWKVALQNPLKTPRDVARLVGIIIWHCMVMLTPLYVVHGCINVMRRVATKILTKSAWDKDLDELDAGITSEETALLRSEVAKAIENPQAGMQLHKMRDTIYAASDASGTPGPGEQPRFSGAGWVLFHGGHQAVTCENHPWTPTQLEARIHIQELWAVLLCVGWLPAVKELTYLVLGCDNTVAVAALTKGYSSCPLIVDLVKKILELCASKNFHLHCR